MCYITADFKIWIKIQNFQCSITISINKKTVHADEPILKWSFMYLLIGVNKHIVTSHYLPIIIFLKEILVTKMITIYFLSHVESIHPINGKATQ